MTKPASTSTASSLTRTSASRGGRASIRRGSFGRSMTTRCAARRSKGGDAAGDDEKPQADAAAFEEARAKDERKTDEDVFEVEAAGKKKQKRKSKKASSKDSSSSKNTTTVAKRKDDETAEQSEEGQQQDAEQTETSELIEQVVNADADAERLESFALKKKRMELIIEEKEWDLESPTVSADERYDRLLEYVNAVEAFKELCSSEVPNTVSDLLEQYVTVYHLPKGAAGHDEAMAFLDLEFDAEDEDGNKVTFTRRFEDIEVDEDDDDDDDDEGEIWINFVVEDESGRFGADYDPENGLHCAQDMDGNWRWLEDDFGRALPEKPFGDFATKLMSVEYMLKIGLNVNSLHKEIDSEELIDFTGCNSWQDVIHASQEVTKALQEMEEDGWKVDPSWDSNYLVVVKELTPLRTMSSVFSDGPIKPEEEEEEEEEEETA